MQPPSTLSEKAMRKLPRWVQSRTRLGKDLARRDIAEITRTIRASRAEAGPRIMHTIDAVQVVPPSFTRMPARERIGAYFVLAAPHREPIRMRVVVRGRRPAQILSAALPERRASLPTIPCRYEL